MSTPCHTSCHTSSWAVCDGFKTPPSSDGQDLPRTRPCIKLKCDFQWRFYHDVEVKAKNFARTASRVTAYVFGSLRSWFNVSMNQSASFWRTVGAKSRASAFLSWYFSTRGTTSDELDVSQRGASGFDIGTRRHFGSRFDMSNSPPFVSCYALEHDGSTEVHGERSLLDHVKAHEHMCKLARERLPNGFCLDSRIVPDFVKHFNASRGACMQQSIIVNTDPCLTKCINHCNVSGISIRRRLYGSGCSPTSGAAGATTAI